MKKYIVKGKNKEELLAKTSKHFNVAVEDIAFEIIKEDKNILGILKEIEMRVWLKSEELKEDAIINKINKKNFEIKILKSGIYLMVDKDSEITNTTENSIIEEIVKREIKIPMIGEISKACRDKKGEFVKIGDYDPEYYIDSDIFVSIQNNKMEAVMDVTMPNRGNPPDYDKIMTKLKSVGIIFGIKDGYIKQFLTNIVYNEPVIVAEGKKPVKGDDADIVFLFSTEKATVIEEKNNDKVDYTNVATINNVVEGQNLARKIPATLGEPGMNILGEIIDAVPGKDRKFPKGKNVKESDDGEFLTASINGCVSLINGIVNVNPLFSVNGNVDFSNGNVSFIGGVHVKGNVSEGFFVKAEGDITIEGIVEDAVLEAGGNIFIKGGIRGKEGGHGEIKAIGNIDVKFIENMTVKSEGDITAREHIIHSNVQAKGKVSVLSGKGRINGGEIIAGKDISALTMGSEYGTSTYLEVGIFPEYRERMKNIERDYLANIDEKDRIEKELATLRKQKEEGNFNEKKQALYLEITKQQFVVLKNINNLKNEKEKMAVLLKDSKKGKIHVLDKMYPSVIIKIAEQQLITKEIFKYATFYMNDNINEISLLPCEITKG